MKKNSLKSSLNMVLAFRTLRSPNNRLQRTVMDNVARHEHQRAAAEPPGRYAA